MPPDTSNPRVMHTLRTVAGARPTGGRRNRCVRTVRRGFSLAELLVVMLVVGILGYLVVPNMEIVKYRMDGAIRGYTAALVMAQRAAVQRQHDVAVIFDTAQQRIRIHEDANNDGVIDAGERVRPVVLSEGVLFGVGAAPYRSASHSAAVTFTQTTADGAPVVRFQRTGSATEHGTIYVTSDRWIRGDKYAGDTRSLDIDRATGRISWYYYDPPQWEQGS